MLSKPNRRSNRGGSNHGIQITKCLESSKLSTALWNIYCREQGINRGFKVHCNRLSTMYFCCKGLAHLVLNTSMYNCYFDTAY